jgi:predicted metalloprotease with PDZ domain
MKIDGGDRGASPPRCYWKRAAVTAVFAACGWAAAPCAARAEAPVRISVDATGAAQKIYHVKAVLPAAPGAFAFVYPHWIPGYHEPVGPIEEMVSVKVLANGQPVDWRRDLVDMYTLHTDVPAGASSIEVDYDVVGAQSQNGQISPVSTSQLVLIEFSNFVIYPQGATTLGTQVDANLTLPHGWTYGTALPIASHSGDTITFSPASLYTVVDSPVIAGAHERTYPLGPTEELDVASDSDAGADVTPKFLAGMKHLVQEGPALYGGRHYRHYHFLLTASDATGIEGIEHHESSDDRDVEKYASDDTQYVLLADLLPHEYSHSWNGKYRRPAGLTPPDLQQPEKTDLLWVYEGMNEYNGEKLAARSGLLDFRGQLDNLAMSAAAMDTEPGRAWRPIRDLADAASFLYPAPHEYYGLRRNANDFYTEGDLIWLDADVTIRRLSHDEKSLDDFNKLWGNGTDQTNPPVVTTYDEDTVLKLLNQVVPYDWAGFFKARIATVQPRAPLNGITAGGYKLVYTDKESDLEKGRDMAQKQIDERYSIGMIIGTDGNEGCGGDGGICDILTDSPAFRAGLAPGTKIIAVDGRRYSADTLRDALRRHKDGTTPLQLIAANGDFFQTVEVDAHDGLRYPRLERDPAVPDELAKIYAPRTYTPTK